MPKQPKLPKPISYLYKNERMDFCSALIVSLTIKMKNTRTFVAKLLRVFK